MKTLNYNKIGIEKINGIKEYHDTNAHTVEEVTGWIFNNLKNRGMTFADLENKKVFVDRYHRHGKDEIMKFKITKAKYGMYKIRVVCRYGGHKTWVFNPKTNLRTEWGNSYHEEWIYEDKLKELENKVKKLEKLNK